MFKLTKESHNMSWGLKISHMHHGFTTVPYSDTYMYIISEIIYILSLIISMRFNIFSRTVSYSCISSALSFLLYLSVPLSMTRTVFICRRSRLGARRWFNTLTHECIRTYSNIYAHKERRGIYTVTHRVHNIPVITSVSGSRKSGDSGSSKCIIITEYLGNALPHY